MISKENYEIWMIDYLDGNLSEEDQKLFLQFLDEHPEYKEELKDLDKTFLSPEESIPYDKTDLFKTEADEIGIPYKDYIAIKETEEGLNPEEIEWKESFVKENNANNIFFEEYKKTFIKTIHSVCYPYKNALKRVHFAPFLTIKNVKQFSIAATIAILLSIGSLSILKQNTKQVDPIASNNKSAERIDSVDVLMHNNIAQTNKPAITKQTTKNQDQRKSTISHIKQLAVTKSIKEHLIERDTIPLIANSAPIQKLHTERVNAYEIGLNEMMPILISIKLQEKQEQDLAKREYISKESERLQRQAWFVTQSARVLNLLSGNNTKIHKIVNEEGELIAYQVESRNITVSNKIRNLSVTN